MSLVKPEKVRTLQRKLYLKAKADHKLRGRGTRMFTVDAIFGELGVLSLVAKTRRGP